MDREHPEWQPFDPDAPASSPVFSDETGAVEEPGVLTLLATRETVGGGWAARAAVGLARECVTRSGRVLLADLALDEPTLHHRLSVDNGEGVSDVFLWGASFRRVTHEVETGLLFASAGTVVAEPREVFESGRWDSVLDGFREAGVTLVLLVPADIDGVDAVLGRSTDLVLLAHRGQVPGVVPETVADRVRAVLGPVAPSSEEAEGRGAEPGAEAAEEVAELGDEAAEEVTELGDDEFDRVGRVKMPGAEAAKAAPEEEAAPSTPEVPPRAPVAETPVEEEPTEPTQLTEPEPLPGARRGGRGKIFLLLALLVVLGMLAAAWAGLVEIPYVTPLLAGTVQARSAPPAGSVPAVPAEPEVITTASSPRAPTASGEVLDHSLALDSLRDGSVARLQARAPGEQRPHRPSRPSTP